MSNKPKICPDCGLPYTAGHACSIIRLEFFADELGEAYIAQVVDADYDVETGEFTTKHYANKTKLDDIVSVDLDDEAD